MAILRSLPNLATKSSVRDEHALSIRELGNWDLLAAQPTSEQKPYHLMLAGFEALDLVNIGLVVLSASGQLLLANRTAENLLKQRDGLELSPLGAVRTSMKCLPSLSSLIDAAASSNETGSRDSVLPMRRPSGKRPLTAVIRSVSTGAAKSDERAPAALLFILDPEIPVETVEAELRQLYGLTSMEACLANLLMEGKALDECCEILEIRRSTARTHLQHLFEKVGVQRQSELVSRLLKSIGLIATKTRTPKPLTSVLR